MLLDVPIVDIKENIIKINFNMKKSTLLAFACALALAPNALAQENAQEVTYVEDPTQGYLVNSFNSNWFITGEGGANILMNKHADERSFMDRFAPAASIYVGKWFSPAWGGRVGVNWLKTKTTSEIPSNSSLDEPMVNGQYYKQAFNHVGPVFDLMCNFTNLACGYKPGRIYNLIGYVGGGGYWTFAKKYENNESKGWKDCEDRILTWRCGIINSFNVSKQVQLSLDLRFSALENHANEVGAGINKLAYSAQAYLGVTYLFRDREWHHPVVPVCPEPENCDQYRALLAAANARIADLETQLKDCLNRPVAEAKAQKEPLATIYYPINVSKINRTDAAVLNAVAQVMKDNPNQQYLLTGWADNYTGNNTINTRLRHNRVNGVEKYLKKQGVPANQMKTQISDQNRLDLGIKYAPMDRCVTIEEAQ